MSVGFKPPSAESSPVEHVVWRMRKDSRIAEARVRLYAHGRELRVTVNEVLFWSRLYRAHEDSRELGAMATGTRQQFEAHGWRLDVEADPARA